MELVNETFDDQIIKYFNCTDSSTKSAYIVSGKSDFAKLYRITLGENPTKRYSRAQQLKDHFLEQWFIVKCEPAYQKNSGKKYLKVVHIEPQNPVRNDAWTSTGVMKRTPRKSRSQSLKNGANQVTTKGDEQVISKLQLGDEQVKSGLQVGDDKTLQDPISFGLEPVLNPTRTPWHINKYTNKQKRLLNPLLPPDVIASYQDRLEVLENSFGFSKDEALELAQEYVMIKYSTKVFLTVPNVANTNEYRVAS